MKYFYYVHTGHRIGLDRFHRAAAIVRELQQEIDITLLCSDYRIAGEARNYGIKRSVGIDVVRNIPQIAQNGDKIIFDSAEINPIMHDDMTRFFSTFIRISDDPEDQKHPDEFLISPYLEGEGICNGVMIDERYRETVPKTIPVAVFFGDDDYEKDLEKLQEIFAPLKADLLMGYYYFLGYEKALDKSFGRIYESEEYDDVIRGSRVLITASPMAALQNLASGGRPVYFQRADYTNEFIPYLEALNVEIVDSVSLERLMQCISNTSSKTPSLVKNSNTQVIEFIRKTFDL